MVKCLSIGLVLLCTLQAQAAHVHGQMKNAGPGEAIRILVPQRYLNGQDVYFRTTLDDQSRFSIPVTILEPQIIFLLYNDDRLALFLTDSDTLQIKSDAFQFPLTVHFGGPASANNRFLQDYLQRMPLDFNEFNNIRFKIGQYWTSVEQSSNERMDELQPQAFKAYMDSLRVLSVSMFEQFENQFPGQLSDGFATWLNAEITYHWAYHLLVYGQVYGTRMLADPAYFDFLYEAPVYSEAIGSQWYRQFLLAFLARQELKSGTGEGPFWAGLYERSGKMLSGKPLSFFRSELIQIAFSAEKYRDLLPFYTNFLQSNPYSVFDEKVEGLYQKYARVLPGSLAPDFQLRDEEGKEVQLTSLRGKVVYLNFWASWCGACLRKMEWMNDYVSEFKNMGIIVVNVSIDEHYDQWQSALARYSFKGIQVLSTFSTGQSLAALYGVEAVPQYFIINRKGEFADKAVSAQPVDIRQKLLEEAR